MAELNTGDGGGKKGSGKVRSKKGNSRVDLTAMVDLAFLLITFFMLTTSLNKPQSMDLGMPDKNPDKTKPEDEMLVPDNRSLTILLGEGDKVKWYLGQFTAPLAGPEQVTYGKEGIRKEILSREQSILAEMGGDTKKGLIVIIKPSKKSTYRNLVDILDEMAICKVPTYAIVDITKEEDALLAN
ncbi:MAG: biopolymer transporter ExbD [Flavobacterium sp.]